MISSISKSTQLNNIDKSFDIVQVFCQIDDICKSLFPNLFEKKLGRPPILNLSLVCLFTLFQQSYCISNLKALHKALCSYHSNDFKLPHYTKFVVAMNNYGNEILAILTMICKLNISPTGQIMFIDSTKLEVCKIWRAGKHKTMKLLATKSKSTTGWYYGIKLHILVDQNGNILMFMFSTSTTDDRVFLRQVLKIVEFSIIVGDAGYLSQELEQLARENNNVLLTAKRSNMKTIGAMWQQELMNMRSTVETVFSVMKTRMNLINTLPRSVNGYLNHYVRTLFKYMFQNCLALDG
jgi:Transposase DDE domain